MKKMIWLTSLFVFFVALIVPGIFALAIDMYPQADQPGYDSNKRLSIYGKREVTQKFVSRDKNLSAIGTSIRNPNLKNKKEISLNLYDENKTLLRTSIINGLNLEDGDFIKFVFTPIPDSLDKTYLFTISSPLAGPEETIEVFYNDEASDGILEFTYDDEVYSGGLPIVTFHRPDTKLEILKEVYFSFFSRLL